MTRINRSGNVVLCVAEVTLGEMLVLLRRRRKLTLAALSALSQIGVSTLYRIEHDDPGVSLDALIAAFATFGIELHADLRAPTDDELRERAVNGANV
jgi:transcriptional regulator with XRE-family HTH domain